MNNYKQRGINAVFLDAMRSVSCFVYRHPFWSRRIAPRLGPRRLFDAGMHEGLSVRQWKKIIPKNHTDVQFLMAGSVLHRCKTSPWNAEMVVFPRVRGLLRIRKDDANVELCELRI